MKRLQKFSREDIEQAIANLQNSYADPTIIEQSNQIIMDWSQTPSSIREAIDIITNSEDERIIFATCRIALANIDHNWMKYSKSDRSVIRDSLCELLASFSGNDITRSKIINLIVAIALKDWPEEWPSCVHDFIYSAADSQEMCILDMQILAELIVTIHETETITNFRRHQLIEEFDKTSNEVMEMIDWSLKNIDFELICVPAIKLLKELCLTAPYPALEQYMEDMLPALFNTFATNEECYEDTMIALSNLLLNRSNAYEVASLLFPETLKIFGEICCGDGNATDYILIFIMNYLSVYGPDVDELCFEGEEMIEDISNLVKSIYEVIANCPPVDEHCEEYWALWSSVLYRYSRSTNSKNPFEVLKPCFQLFQPLIPLIRESLYQAFPSAAEGGKLKSTNCQACWIFITSADKNGMIEFLQEQEPSPSLCYAIGLVDACLSGRDEREMIVKVFPSLFEFNQKSQDIGFGVSLLYALSHAIRFMNKEITFLTAFGICLLNFLRSDELAVRTAAVNALFYIAMRQPKLLIREEKITYEDDDENEEGDQSKPKVKVSDDNEGEGSIIFGVYGILYDLSDWDLKNLVKILKSVALVASSRSTSASRSKIYDNVSNTISGLLSNGDSEVVKNSLNIINSLTTLKLVEGSKIFIPLYGDLINLLSQTTDQNDEILSGEIIDTITSSLLVDPNPDVFGNVEDFTSILLQLSDFRDPALLSFSRLRPKYEVLENIFDQIFEDLIKDVIYNLAQESDQAFPILRFMRIFNMRKSLISLLLEVTVYFIKDERLEVAKEALKLLRKIIEFLCDDQESPQQEQQESEQEQPEKVDLTMIVNVRMHLIDTTFSALTDTFHKPIFKNIAKAIQALYRAMSVASMAIPPDQFDKDMHTVLSTILPNFENSSGDFIINFSRALRSHFNDFEAFSNDLKEFLVTTNCASPSDKNLFRNELKLDSLEQELMNLVAGEEKSAIVAEELEILPQLKNFYI